MKHAVSKVFMPDFVIIPLITVTDRIIFILDVPTTKLIG